MPFDVVKTHRQMELGETPLSKCISVSVSVYFAKVK